MLILVDPDIGLDVDMFDEFVAVPTTCNYSEVFVGLNMTCNASKPVEVLPELTLNWLLNGNEIMGEVEYIADNMVATTVTLNSEDPTDTNYTCSAELIIPELLNIENSIVYEVVFKGKCRYISRFYCVSERLDSNTVRAAGCINWTAFAYMYSSNVTIHIHDCNYECSCPYRMLSNLDSVADVM